MSYFMKSLFAVATFIITGMILTSGCSKDNHGSNNGSANSSGEKIMKPENALYMGAVVYEIGNSKGELSFSKENLSPLVKIYLCIRKGAEANQGQFDVDFKALGTPPYSAQVYQQGKLQKTQIPVITINYDINGKVSDDILKLQSIAKVRTSTQFDTKYNRISRAFDFEFTNHSLFSEKISFYGDNNENYIKSVYQNLYVDKKGAHAVAACEDQDKVIVVKSAFDK